MDLDTQCPGFLRRLHGPLHGAAETDAARELIAYSLGDKRRVEFGLLDLDDVQLHFGIGCELLQAGGEPLALGALTADHNAGARGMNVDS